jgi:membrane-associated phospholipid phosphatase
MDRRPLPWLPAVLSVAVAVLAVRSVVSGGPAAIDRSVLDWVLAHRGPGPVSVVRFVTNTGASPVLFPLVALAGLAVRLRTGRWRPAVVALAVAGAGVGTRLGLSVLVREARPPSSAWAVPVGGFSFPSGHTATSALIAGALAWLLSLLLPARWMTAVAAAVLGTWAVLVGLSRIYLGVHWVSDILAGWLLAGAWLTLLTLGRPGPPRATDPHLPSAHAVTGGLGAVRPGQLAGGGRVRADRRDLPPVRDAGR